MTRPGRAAAVAIAALAFTQTIGGCAFDPASIPVPGTTVSGDTYPLHIQFVNVLNLPPGAKVMANGVEVGNLDKVELVDATTDIPGELGKGYAMVTVDIKTSVKLPTTTTAELQQATPLGDVRIALTTPSTAATGTLAPGATLPMAQTSVPLQVEDTLAGLATFVSGGPIQSFTDTLRQLNASLPQNPDDTARIFEVIGNDLVDVAANVQSVDSLLDGLQANADSFLTSSAKIDALLSEYGVQHTVDVTKSVVSILDILINLGPLSHNALWLAPLVGSLDHAVRALVPVLNPSSQVDLSGPAQMTKLVELIRDKLIPYVDHGPKVNIVSVSVAGGHVDSASEQTDRIIDTLRMIGAVR